MNRPLAPSRHVAAEPEDPRSRSIVSPTSAERFAARVRARRRRRRLLGVLAAALLAGLGWVALWSPWATVESVEVSGTERVPRAEVLGAAEAEVGRSMLLARTDDVAAAIRGAQPLVRSVTVTRQWPSTLRIVVVERAPVAAVPTGREVRLVDADGVVVQRVAAGKVPRAIERDLPRVEVDLERPDAVASLRACVEVSRGLPVSLERQVRRLGATTPDRVWLQLAGGARVDWGSGEDTPRKAEVLLALLPQKASSYDVRSPDTPAVRR
jgi:cell division protein FtsQ